MTHGGRLSLQPCSSLARASCPPEGQQGTRLSFLVSGCATREPTQPSHASSHAEWGCACAGHVGAWPSHPRGPCPRPLLAQDEGRSPCSLSSHHCPFWAFRLHHSAVGTGPRVAWLGGIQVGIMVSAVGGGLRSGSPKPRGTPLWSSSASPPTF